MTTGEGFAWLIFLIIMNLLFFAAFGSQNINEKSIEEYIDSLMADEKPNGGQKWVWKSSVFHVAKQQSLKELKGNMLEVVT